MYINTHTQKFKEVIAKVEASIQGPYMRGDAFSLADVAAAPFFQVGVLSVCGCHRGLGFGCGCGSE